jgi:uncharacterized protein GlcG (DUF336 family)
MTKRIIFSLILILVVSGLGNAQERTGNKEMSGNPQLIKGQSIGAPAGGASLKPAPGPSLDTALSLAQAAIAACKAKGSTISVSVVDSAGQAKVTLNADGSSAKSSTAVRKAATAVAFKASGSEMEIRAKNDKAFSDLISANPNEYNNHAGSLVLKVNGEVIGGIGISGAATHEMCEECCHEAIANVSLKLP